MDAFPELGCNDDPTGSLTTASVQRIPNLHNHPNRQPCLCRLAALASLSESDYER
jgi:hypothetical protein